MRITKKIRQLIVLWLFAIPQFFLGIAITKFLGYTLDWNVFWLGLIWIILMGIVSIYLFMFSNELGKDPQVMRYRIRENPYRNWLLISGLILVLLFVSTVSLIQAGSFNPISGFITLIIFLGAFFLGVRPVRIYYSGLGELVMALIIGFFVPALSLQLQIHDLHRLLIFSAVPITLLVFSFQLATQIEDFGAESKLGEKRLVARMGWENGFVLHNSFMIIAYLAVGVAGLLGLPQVVALPVFISFPLAGLQIWHFQQISNGASPRWKFLSVNNILILSTVIFIFMILFFIR